jgi:hypothetical protein
MTLPRRVAPLRRRVAESRYLDWPPVTRQPDAADALAELPPLRTSRRRRWKR